MNICVIGIGYVGLTTGAVLADLGNDVICVDIDKEKLKKLEEGIMPIYEPGLKEIVLRNIEEGRFVCTDDLQDAVKRSEVVFICVGTPPQETGQTDLSQVESAAKEIAAAMDGYKIIVNKSTVPVGTGDFVRNIIEGIKGDSVEFDVVSNPEFLREGTAIYDTLHPDRVIIGASSQLAAAKLLELYAVLECPMVVTDVYSAEMIKYASNSFLAMKISFINAVADMCELVGADVTVVSRGIGHDQRIGKQFLNAGLGFGGSCFPKDVESLIHTSDSYGYDFKILKEVMDINAQRELHFTQRIKKVMGDLNGKTIGVWGLAFKPNTDDIREAKAIEIIKILLKEGATIKAYDPQAMENTQEVLQGIEYCSNAYEVAQDCDAVVLATEWREFKQLNMEKVLNSMKGNYLFDGRNFYDPEKTKRTGFSYYGIGRESKNSSS